MTREAIQIVTIYSAGGSPERRRARRVLAMISLVVAVVWLVQCLYPWRVMGHNTLERWLKGRLLMSSASQSIDTMGGQEDPWVALGLAPAKKAPGVSVEQQREQRAAEEKALQGRMAVLWADFYIWKAITGLAGLWLAMAGLVGLTGRAASVKLHRQAAWWMILSAVVSVLGIEIAIRYGGMPANADSPFYLKIAGVQSSYAWVLLVATRWMR